MIEILCDDSTSCEEACDNNDYHRSRQRQTFNMSVKSMRISLDHFFYFIVKVIDNIFNNSPWA